jgi:hypothetical protein
MHTKTRCNVVTEKQQVPWISEIDVSATPFAGKKVTDVRPPGARYGITPEFEGFLLATLVRAERDGKKQIRVELPLEDGHRKTEFRVYRPPGEQRVYCREAVGIPGTAWSPWGETYELVRREPPGPSLTSIKLK